MSVKKVEFTVVKRIMAALNLGEEGQLTNFFLKIKRQLETDVKKLRANIEKLEFDHKINVQEIDDQIEDAKASLEESFVKVDTDKLKTNESQKAYIETYMRQIKSAEQVLTTLEKNKEDLVERFEKMKETYQKDIDKINKRIKELFV